MHKVHVRHGPVYVLTMCVQLFMSAARSEFVLLEVRSRYLEVQVESLPNY